MPTITISGNDYEVYVTRAEATAYLTASLSASATAWLAASPTAQDQSIIMATRYLDSQIWAGEKTSPTQTLEWPRTGVTELNGDALDSATVPQAIKNACMELAALIRANPTLVEGESGGGSNIQAVTGPVGVTFFAPQAATALPSLIMRLVGRYLGSAGASTSGSYGAGEATGTCSESEFDDSDRYDLTGGL